MAYGFRIVRKKDGPYTGVMEKRTLSTANNPAARGDVVRLNTGAGTVYFDTAGSETSGVDIVGIAQYFEWTDDDNNFHQSNYVAASTASATVTVTCYYLPLTEDVICTCIADDVTSAVAKTLEGANFAFIHAAPNAKRGLSGSMLDSNTNNTTATLPLQLVGLSPKPGNAYGNTAGTVEVEVLFVCTHSRRLGSTGSA